MSRGKRPPFYFGPYRMPKLKYGETVIDASRGEVRIVGLSDAPIPWPIGKRDGVKSPILYKGLARTVRKEPAKAIMRWWGVGFKPVTRWRKALGVEHENAGTTLLRKANANSEWWKRAQRNSWTMPRSLEWRMKIGARQLGKRVPVQVRRAISKAHRGKRLSTEHRRKVQNAHRRRPKPEPRTSPGVPGKMRSRGAGHRGEDRRSLYDIHVRRQELFSSQ